MLTLAGALLSPLHWLGEHLFTFHMIEHEIVMAVSSPLIVFARPVGTLLWGLPGTARRVAGSVMHWPLVRGPWDWCTGATNATIIHGAAIWAWHMPVLFDAAVTNPALHRLQHLSFFATAILFWWAIVWRSDYGAAAWHLFATMIHTSILGALMALAPRVLYVAQTQTAMAWGLTPLEDQQLAGMIMWVPAGTIYAAAAMTMLALWIRGSSERRTQNA
jgi:putative membrane protein